MPAAGRDGGARSTRFGSCSASFATLLSSGGIVAENISVCRFVGQQLEDAAQVGREAHVDHAVGLVEHEHLDLVEAHALAALQVEQAARRRDQQVHAWPRSMRSCGPIGTPP